MRRAVLAAIGAAAAIVSPGCIIVVHDRDAHVRAWRDVPGAGPRLGIEVGTLDHVAARQLELDPDRVTVVAGVRRGSPADHAGLLACDIITSIDGRPDADLGALRAALRDAAPGQELRLGILREGNPIEACVTPR